MLEKKFGLLQTNLQLMFEDDGLKKIFGRRPEII